MTNDSDRIFIAVICRNHNDWDQFVSREYVTGDKLHRDRMVLDTPEVYYKGFNVGANEGTWRGYRIDSYEFACDMIPEDELMKQLMKTLSGKRLMQTIYASLRNPSPVPVPVVREYSYERRGYVISYSDGSMKFEPDEERFQQEYRSDFADAQRYHRDMMARLMAAEVDKKMRQFFEP